MLGAYKIIHIKSGKFYVGSSRNIEARLLRHWKDLSKGNHHNVLLQKLFKSCGKEGFRVKKKKCKTRKQAYRLELETMQSADLKKLLNIGKGVIGGDNLTRNPRYKLIVKKIKEGTQRFMNSLTEEERLAKFSKPGTLNGMYGRTHTKKVRDKLSKLSTGNSYAKGYVWTAEQRAGLSKTIKENGGRFGASNPFYGRTHSKETREKLSKINKGKIPPTVKAVKIDGKKFKSIAEAGRVLGIPMTTVWHRCRNTNPKFKNYQFI